MRVFDWVRKLKAKLLKLVSRRQQPVLNQILNGSIPYEDWTKAMNKALLAWHNSEATEEIYEFMGMTFEEYARWAQAPSSIYSIVHDRVRGNFK
jgi:hypothetical protein